MSLAEFSSVMQARALLKSTSIEGQGLQAELAAWEKSIVASYTSTERLPHLASMLINDLKPQGKTIYETAPKDARGASKYRAEAMKKGNSNFLVTDTNLQYIWKAENLPIPSIQGTKVSVGSIYSQNIEGYTLLDAFNVWLRNTNHIIKSEDPITGKSSSKRYLSYSNKNTEYYGEEDTKQSKLSDNTNAIRIKKTGHTSTAIIMYQFLVACGYTEEFYVFTTNYQIGHIDSQAHMKAIVTRNAKNSPAYSEGLIDKLLQLLKYLDLGSSSLKPRHSGAIAAISKNSIGGKAYVDLEIQATGFGAKNAKDVTTNQGSGDLSNALGIVAILKELGSTSVYKNTISGPVALEIRQLGASVDQIASNLKLLHTNFIKNEEKIRHALRNFSNGPDMAEFLLDLKSSDSMRTLIKKSVVHSLDPKSPKPIFKANLKNVPILKLDTSSSTKLIQDNKKLANSIKQQLNKVKVLAAKTSKINTPSKPKATGPNFTMPGAPLRTNQGNFYSLASLQQLLNDNLQHVISATMGGGERSDILNYRSGRFAASVKVERMSQSRAGMISAFYSYMKNPYQTFEPGFAQGSPKTRDPKLLIAKSIREIAATKVGNRLRAVSV